MPGVGRQVIPLGLEWTVCRDLVTVYPAVPAGNASHLRYLGLHFGFAFGLGRLFAGDYPNRLVIANKSAGD